uniref:Butyrophilin-like protein 1 n=1 Tax=Maylandia zebra TaxID=106582 RepID=A0A3P9D3L7_9CICH|nr:butyrophilin-like protein 1 isoform X2 [Maylandia zebra]
MLSASQLLWFLAFPILYSLAEGIKVFAPEGSDAILPCSFSTKENIVQKLFDWRKVDPNKQEVFMYDGGLHYSNGLPGQDEHFRGRVSYFSQELQFGNASIIIRNTTVADSGNYTCGFPHLQPEQTFNIKLVVEHVITDRFGDTPGAVLKPLVGILNISEDKAWLKCEVRGASPKPKVEWRDSDGNILPAEEPQVSYKGDHYYITLLTTVTRTNTNIFHCVATQEEIGHKTKDKLYVPYCAEAPKPHITILGATESGVQLKCDVGGVHPKPKLQWKDSDGNVLSAEDPVISERGGRYNVTLCTTVTPTKTNCFHCVVKQEGSYQVIDQEINLSENLFKSKSGQVITGWLGGCFIGILSFAFVLAVLVTTKTISIHFNRGCLRNANSSSEETTAPGSETGPEELRVLRNGSVV